MQLTIRLYPDETVPLADRRHRGRRPYGGDANRDPADRQTMVTGEDGPMGKSGRARSEALNISTKLPRFAPAAGQGEG
jgi:hypothetical protein